MATPGGPIPLGPIFQQAVLQILSDVRRGDRSAGSGIGPRLGWIDVASLADKATRVVETHNDNARVAGLLEERMPAKKGSACLALPFVERNPQGTNDVRLREDIAALPPLPRQPVVLPAREGMAALPRQPIALPVQQGIAAFLRQPIALPVHREPPVPAAPVRPNAAAAPLGVRPALPLDNPRPRVLPPPHPARGPIASALSAHVGGSPSVSAADVHRAFIQERRYEMDLKKATGRSLNEREWYRIRGVCMVSGEIPSPGASSMDWEASVGPSDYEYADVRLSPNIFLGRWNPLADGARRAPPPAAAISGGFVAVKVLQSRFAAVNPKGVSRELEAHMRTCRSEQESPGARHFVRLIDAYGRPSEEVDFKVFLIQELCLGTLEDRLQWAATQGCDSAALTERERVYVALATARALHFMHSVPILHRDLRTSNVFYGADGAVLLGDFGLSREALAAADEGVLVADVTAFSPDRLLFMAPETYRGAAEGGVSPTVTAAATAAQPRVRVTSATDVWLLGQTLFMLFANGCRPFVPAVGATGPLDVPLQFAAHRERLRAGERPCYESLHPDTPPAMLDLIGWMLEPSPDARPDMDAVLAHPAFWHEAHFSLLRCVEEGPLVSGSATISHATPDSDPLPSVILKSRLEDEGVPRDTVERRIVESLEADQSLVYQLRVDPPVREVTVAQCVASWRSDFLSTLAACIDEMSGKPEPTMTEEEAASLIKMGGGITSTALKLGVYLRHYCSHAAEFLPGVTTRSGVQSDSVIDALHTQPFTRSTFPSRFELYIRHPATGWFWPRLWRRLHAERGTLPPDVLRLFHVP